MKPASFRKTVLLNRAIPGSGKTAIARSISDTLASNGLHVGNHSTDDYFMRDGRYCFDVRKLMEYHQRNLLAFQRDLEVGKDGVICDNTNLLPWQTAPYTRLARRYGYRIVFLNFPPREFWKHIRAQQVTPQKPDAHQVPEDALATFVGNFYKYNDLLYPGTPVNSQIHRDYHWDDTSCRPVETGCPAKHFDRDVVLTIDPDRYRMFLKTIGRLVLEMMEYWI